MPKLVNWKQCCGCGSCANKCPKQAITMLPNHEGFLHPEVNVEMCVECGACEKACPGLLVARNEQTLPQAFIVQHKDDAIRYQSTSGGAFTAIAEEVIRRGGVVCGAVMTNELTVKHDFVSDIIGLARFRNSKYVQSEIGNAYIVTQKFLNKGRYVCFSGTPCQINGLYKYLNKDYENLIAVDVVCKSVPSPLVFAKYVEWKQLSEGKLSDIVFRDKKRGFLYCTMAHYKTHEARKEAKDVYRRGSESDEWLRLFLSGKISRRSCMSCPYQTTQRVGDITLGDIWETNNLEFDDNKGSTLIHVWTEKGIAFLDSIKNNVKIKQFPEGNQRGVERTNTITLRTNREELFDEVHKLPVNAFFEKYAPYSMKVRAKQWGRYLIWRLHLHNVIRHIKHIVIHK